MKISDLDSNFRISTTVAEPDIVWLDVKTGKFDVYGLYDYLSEGVFRRMPREIAENTNSAVASYFMHTTGGRIRFRTDSPYIAIKVKYHGEYTWMEHMPLVGSAGFDIYCDNNDGSEYCSSFFPNKTNPYEYESQTYPFQEAGMRSYTINFPLYSSVDALYIGLKNGSELLPGKKYKFEKPIVFYGSSITHGGCASRPGNSYPSMLSRVLDSDYTNLGFSGAARGEEIMANYIAGLEMSVFVLDYDYNAPTAEHLLNTHEKFFKIIRKAQPDLPVVMVSRPNFDGKNKTDNIQRRNIVYTTYINAFKDGDNSVYFVDGERLFDGFLRDSCTVDGTHPNDLGFYRMATTLLPLLQRLLK